MLVLVVLLVLLVLLVLQYSCRSAVVPQCHRTVMQQCRSAIVLSFLRSSYHYFLKNIAHQKTWGPLDSGFQLAALRASFCPSGILTLSFMPFGRSGHPRSAPYPPCCRRTGCCCCCRHRRRCRHRCRCRHCHRRRHRRCHRRRFHHNTTLHQHHQHQNTAFSIETGKPSAP